MRSLTPDTAGLISPATRWAWLALGLVAFLAVSIAPLAAHLVLTAVFGLLHVLTEMRYVDSRFSSRLPQRWLALVLVLVALVVCNRAGLALGVGSPSTAVALELAAGVVLACAGASQCPPSPLRWVVGSGLLAFAVAASIWPFHTLWLLALLHNLTPLAFLAERVAPARRPALLGGLCLVFVVVPCMLAWGGAQRWVGALTGIAPDVAPFDVGPSAQYLATFLPPGTGTSDSAWAFFGAAVFAQAMHYFAVIVVLPRCEADPCPRTRRSTLMPWGRPVVFWGGAIVAALGLMLLYAVDLRQARTVYALFAGAHSWLEIPLLIALLGMGLSPQPAPGEGEDVGQQRQAQGA